MANEPTAQRQPVAVHVFHFLPILVGIMGVAPCSVTIYRFSQRTYLLISPESKWREMLFVPKQKAALVSTEPLQIKYICNLGRQKLSQMSWVCIGQKWIILIDLPHLTLISNPVTQNRLSSEQQKKKWTQTPKRCGEVLRRYNSVLQQWWRFA